MFCCHPTPKKDVEKDNKQYMRSYDKVDRYILYDNNTSSDLDFGFECEKTFGKNIRYT